MVQILTRIKHATSPKDNAKAVVSREYNLKYPARGFCEICVKGEIKKRLYGVKKNNMLSF